MPKYKVNFLRATFYPQVLGEKIVQRSTVNGSHNANTSCTKSCTLNYLGFTSRKLGDFKSAEIYYLSGLKIEPNHNGINEYLGELYLSTDRKDKALERLKVLKNCKCDEYIELKELIEGKKESKY